MKKSVSGSRIMGMNFLKRMALRPREGRAFIVTRGLRLMLQRRNVQRPTSNVQRSNSRRCPRRTLPLNVERWTLNVGRFFSKRSSGYGPCLVGELIRQRDENILERRPNFVDLG